MPIQDTIRATLDELQVFGDPLDRLEYLVDRARAMPPLPESARTEENRIDGCMARLWMTVALVDGHCRFKTDSDSMIVKSIAGLLASLYDGATPQEILENPPDFLAEAGITSHLSANRRNALTQVWKKIRAFAENNR
ncbi:MAG TPA: SufE family protein [Kiritimatiellia bacterium]|nr:SufE family protein [Kiritimatiellia bacterium]HMO99571.1 SufE family protein [Kiritimatiellia bacterium]HMP97554.1 SufE family protein [Kiritimatiellia bacterium]